MNKLDFTLAHQPDMSLLQIRLKQGQSFYAEPSVMASMDSGIQLKAGLKGGLLKSIGRALGGESLIINTFSAPNADGEVNLAPGPMGDILHYRLDGTGIMLQRGAYVANSEGVEINGKWDGMRGFFSGEGMVLLKATGTGDLFFNTYGAILKHEVDFQNDFIVDTGYVVAFEDTLDYHVTTVPGLRSGGKLKTLFFGGEGLVCNFKGKGKVWIQTRTVNPFLRWVHPYRRVKKGNNN